MTESEGYGGAYRPLLLALLVGALLAVFVLSGAFAASAGADDDDDDDVAAQVEDDDDDDGGTGAAQEEDEDFVSDEVVVKLDPREGATIAQVNADYGTVVRDELLGSAGIYLLGLPAGASVEATAERMEADRRLVYAEPNFVTDAPEGNPRWSAWGGRGPFPSDDAAPYPDQYAVSAMNLSCAHQAGGAGAVVAVLDTGAQPGHPALSGRLVPGYDFVDDDPNPADEPNGRDDDGDGYVDEMVGHGTHVAGVVALAAPEASIMPLRVLDPDGRGNVFVIAEALLYAERGGADVANLSLGSARESDLLEDVLEDVSGDDDDDEPAKPGMFVAGSAGNANQTAEQYPAAEDGVMAVASVDEGGKKSGFSNYGDWVDVSAPGEEIYSAFPESRYALWDGTSMAAPFVAGQAALIRALDPDRSAEDVAALISATARNLDSEPTYASSLGAGHADAGASVRELRPESGC
jgi:thermitase